MRSFCGRLSMASRSAEICSLSVGLSVTSSFLPPLHVHADANQNAREPCRKQRFIPQGSPLFPCPGDGFRHRVKPVAFPAQIARRDAV